MCNSETEIGEQLLRTGPSRNLTRPGPFSRDYLRQRDVSEALPTGGSLKKEPTIEKSARPIQDPRCEL